VQFALNTLFPTPLQLLHSNVIAWINTPNTALHHKATCSVLAVTFYDIAESAEALVSVNPCLYCHLQPRLQRNKQIIMSVLHAKPTWITEVARCCESSVFRSDRDILMASKACYLTLQYASKELRQDTAFVEAMMQGNVRAVEFASPAVLTYELVTKFFDSMTQKTVELLLRKSYKLQHNKAFVAQALKRWPTLSRTGWGLVQLVFPGYYDIPLGVTPASLDSNDRIKACGIRDAQDAKNTEDESSDDTDDDSSNDDESSNDDDSSDDDDEQHTTEVSFPVHKHELVLCTSNAQLCSVCGARMNGNSTRYRCAVWCRWSCCVACATKSRQQPPNSTL
jgi:hypothetical protein